MRLVTSRLRNKIFEQVIIYAIFLSNPGMQLRYPASPPSVLLIHTLSHKCTWPLRVGRGLRLHSTATTHATQQGTTCVIYTPSINAV